MDKGSVPEIKFAYCAEGRRQEARLTDANLPKHMTPIALQHSNRCAANHRPGELRQRTVID